MPASAPAFIEEEDARLRVLETFDSEALEDDPELLEIVRFAARLCGAPASMVSLVERDRQYFLAREGTDQRETPRSTSFCVHTFGRQGVMEIPDATQDSRFADNPAVTGEPHVRYYAGQPLVSDEGAPLGTLCVIDVEPHAEMLSDFQREGLAVLARAAMRRLKARREEVRGERRFAALAESVPTIAFSTDSEGEVDYLNRRWSEFTGIEDGLDPAIRFETLHPDERETVIANWKAAIASGEPYECEYRMRDARGDYRWMLTRASPANVGRGGQQRWFGTITDIDQVHRLSEARDMLARELSHRIKNIFAVITGLVLMRARKSPENREFAEGLVETLHALSRAHDYVRPSQGARREGLLGLLEVIFAPYSDETGAARVSISGDDAEIGARSATPLALVFHELATNSAKYGALGVAEGHVTLAVEVDEGSVRLRWDEHGGPPPVDTGEEGFGSRLVEMAVTGQLQGSWERRFEADGLKVDLALSAAAIAL